MAEIFSVYGHDGTDWNIEIGSSDRTGYCGSAFGDKISVGGFQDSTHKTDGSMSADGCSPNHMRNCKYISPTQVDLGAGAVDLTTGNVAQTDCTRRWSYQDDTGPTVISNVQYFCYDGVDPANPPTGVKAVAFERTASAIRKNRIGGDTDGKAWDSDYGIGGNSNALDVEGQASSSIHNWYLGDSRSPSSAGLKTACKARLEFDVS